MGAMEFVGDVAGLFSSALEAMLAVPVLAFFLAVGVLAVVYALVRYLYFVSKTTGVK
jgi:hypothetical protein